MKITLVSNLYSPYAAGGAEKNVEKLAQALTGYGQAVSVITTGPFEGLRSLFPEVEVRDNIKIFRFFPLNLFHVYDVNRRSIGLLQKIIWRIIDIFNIHSFFTVLYILGKEKPDIVHTSNLGGLSFSIVWAAFLHRIPLVHTIRDFHLLCPYAGYLMCPYSGYKTCEKRPLPCRVYSLLKKVVLGEAIKNVIAPSHFAIDLHLRYGFFRHANCKVIPNFVEDRSLQTENKKHAGTLNFLFVGRITPEKGIDVMVRAFRDIPDNCLRLDIVGDGPEMPMVEKIVSGDHRIHIQGRKNSAELNNFYLNADILIAPSIWYDNFPTVILEAFSYGVCVIASRVGGIPELVADGYNGFLVSPGDSGSITQKIKFIMDDFKAQGGILTSMANNAKDSCKQYRPDIIINSVLEFYNSLIEKKENLCVN